MNVEYHAIDQVYNVLGGLNVGEYVIFFLKKNLI